MNNTFQSVLLITFGFIGVIAVLIFSGIIPIGNNTNTFGGQVTLWGYVPEEAMRPIINDLNSEYKDQLILNYVYKSKDTLENQLISALADGVGPDLLMFPHDLIVKQTGKVFPIPYESYPERNFKDSFVEIGEVFLSANGILALPVFADPMVMYWNRDLFSSANVVSYPKFWIEFLNLPDLLTKKDSKGNVFQSAVALGTYKNINNAKEIISTLLLQSGDQIVKRKYTNDGVRTDSFDVVLGIPESPAQSAVHFYTEFANQSKAAYSWNSSLPVSKKAFEAGTLAVYFGKASEYRDIKRNNPHLNFDVAMMPQRDNVKTKLTYSDLGGISILKSSKNINTAIKVAYELSNPVYGKAIASGMSLPSVRRDVLNESAKSPELSVFNDSSLISKTWYDPDKNNTEIIFGEMIDSILSGRSTEIRAVSDAKSKLSQYVGK